MEHIGFVSADLFYSDCDTTKSNLFKPKQCEKERVVADFGF